MKNLMGGVNELDEECSSRPICTACILDAECANGRICRSSPSCSEPKVCAKPHWCWVIGEIDLTD